MEVEIAYEGKSAPGSLNYFKLKITQYENFKVDCKNLLNSKLYSILYAFCIMKCADMVIID